MNKKYTFFILILILIKVFFQVLFGGGVIGGDWPYFYEGQLSPIEQAPFSWKGSWDMGKPFVVPWIDSYLYSILTLFVHFLGISWNITHVLFFYLPPLIFGVISSCALYWVVTKRISVIPAFIYVLSTDFLMIYGGGQAGIFLAYSLAPLFLASVLLSFEAIRQSELRFRKMLPTSIVSGLVFSVIFLFDIRIAYVCVTGTGVIFLTELISSFKIKKAVLLTSAIVIPLFITGLTHLYWVLPTIFASTSPVENMGDAYSGSEAVKFFSFAFFENSFTTLHPNWPENIFGKVFFMRSEFILMPILAFASLLFVNMRKDNENYVEKRRILSFGLIAILGAFLAKGANDPFGNVYVFLFERFPGFFMFRDSTKFYPLIILSYAVLIPYAILHISNWLLTSKVWQKKVKINTYLFFSILFVAYLLILVRPVLFNDLSGTFQKGQVPEGYKAFAQNLSNDKEFFRTLWIPATHRFAYYTNTHPFVDGLKFFQATNSAEIFRELDKEGALEMLQNASIRYVAVPIDPHGEIFMEDRKYDEKKYHKVVTTLQNIPWLSEKRFADLYVFEVPDPKGHFYFRENDSLVMFNAINPTRYELIDAQGRIIFSERYNADWVARVGSQTIRSENYHGLNSFNISENVDVVTVEYSGQKLMNLGIFISLASLIIILGLFFWIYKKV